MPKILGTVWGPGSHFSRLFDKTIDISSVNQLEECSALLLHGGTDIASSLYNEDSHKRNQNREGKPSGRDLLEWNAIKKAVEMGIPIFGICRGLQLLCAYDGGKLIQDLPKAFHGEAYMALTDSSDRKWTDVFGGIHCPVSHHQAVVLKPNSLTKVYAYEHQTFLPYAVMFGSLNAFGVQGHPEWAGPNDPFVQYCLDIFEGMLK